MTEKKIPEWFIPWKDAGFIRPETAKKWLISGFKPEMAAPWYDLDEVEVHIASDWIKQGFTASEYLAWTRKGFRSPTKAFAWRTFFPDPSIAEHWRTLGLRIDGHFGELLTRGYAPEVVLHAEITNDEISVDQLANWLDNFQDVEQLATGDVRAWYATGLSPEEIKHWLALSVRVSLAAEFRRIGWKVSEVERLFDEWGSDVVLFSRLGSKATPLNVLGWKALNVVARTAIEWIQIGADPFVGKAWCDIGVFNSQIAAKWSREGCGPDEVDALRVAGWAKPSDFSRMKMKGWRVEDIVNFLKTGVGKATIDEWFVHNKMGFERWTKFLKATIRSESVRAWQSVSIPMNDWPIWIDLIHSRPEICAQWLTTGISPQELAEMLKDSRSQADEFDEELTGAHLLNVLKSRNKYIERNYVSASTRRTTNSPAVKPAIPSPDLESRVSQSVVDEFQAKAFYLFGEIRKMPPPGTEFIDIERGISIQIDSVTDSVQVSVRFGAEVMQIEFDPTNFDPLTEMSSTRSKIAFVLALSWFIDCAVTLKSKYQSTNKNFRTESTSSINERSQSVRYVPTMQFVDSVRAVRSGEGVSPVMHEVSGHIRQLPMGHTPSPEAISRAPGFLRKKMRQGDTFVAGHTRGLEGEIAEFAVRLSKYSMTAHAFANVLRA
jgi:hypothetical protein